MVFGRTIESGFRDRRYNTLPTSNLIKLEAGNEGVRSHFAESPTVFPTEFRIFVTRLSDGNERFLIPFFFSAYLTVRRLIDLKQTL